MRFGGFIARICKKYLQRVFTSSHSAVCLYQYYFVIPCKRTSGRTYLVQRKFEDIILLTLIFLNLLDVKACIDYQCVHTKTLDRIAFFLVKYYELCYGIRYIHWEY